MILLPARAVLCFCLGGRPAAARLYRTARSTWLPSLVVTGLLISTPWLRAAELHVPLQFRDIAEAVHKARAGDTVRVDGGSFTGNLILDKRIHLLGYGRPVIQGEGQGAVVVIVADGCTLSGFTLENSGMSMTLADAGIRIRSSNNRVEGNRIVNCLFGIYLDGGRANRVRGNLILGITAKELGDRGSGIHLYDSHENVLEDNTVIDARDGIYFDHANGNTVRGCSFRGSRYGLHYMYADDNSYIENLFSECIAGAAIMFSRRVDFEGNWFVHNRGFSAVGVLFKDCYRSTSTRNLFADNSTALVVDNSMENTLRHNVFSGNDVALHLFTGSDRNMFVENNFTDNLSPIRVMGKRASTIWAENGRGNYWSDYEGYDLDGDGIGDVPHRIQNVFEFLESEYAPLRFLLISPVAIAMKAGEEAFPMFEFSREVDPAPLVEPVTIPLSPRWAKKPDLLYRHVAAGVFGAFTVGLSLAVLSRTARRRGRTPLIRQKSPGQDIAL